MWAGIGIFELCREIKLKKATLVDIELGEKGGFCRGVEKEGALRSEATSDERKTETEWSTCNVPL